MHLFIFIVCMHTYACAQKGRGLLNAKVSLLADTTRTWIGRKQQPSFDLKVSDLHTNRLFNVIVIPT